MTSPPQRWALSNGMKLYQEKTDPPKRRGLGQQTDPGTRTELRRQIFPGLHPACSLPRTPWTCQPPKSRETIP